MKAEERVACIRRHLVTIVESIKLIEKEMADFDQGDSNNRADYVDLNPDLESRREYICKINHRITSDYRHNDNELYEITISKLSVATTTGEKTK